MGKIKEMYIEMLDRELQNLSLDEYLTLKHLEEQYAAEQFSKEQNIEDSEESV